VWKDAFVSESSLTEAIGVLRQALGDSALGAEYIQTVHRRGYRFVAPLSVEADTTLIPSVVAPDVQPDAPAQGAAPGAPRRQIRKFAIAGALLIAAAVIAALARLQPWADDVPGVTRATITLPPSEAPAPGHSAQPIAALSPDGRRIVYVAGASGSFRLFLRSIDQYEAIPLPGTDGGFGPFFSPDGASIGFFARGRLFVKKLPDGESIDLADAGAGFGGWWHSDGTILFATGDGLYRIPRAGGTAVPIAIAGFDGATLRHPTLLDDGRTLLATEWNSNVRNSRIVVIDLELRTIRQLARGVHARAIPDGRVVYLRDGDLVAAPIDGAGPETPLISGVMTGVSGAGQYALSASGTLLYVPERPARLARRIVRISADGKELPLPFDARPYHNAVLSPDGRRLLATIYERGASDLWLGDVARGVLQRLTSEGSVFEPVWSRDGSTVYFTAPREGRMNIYRMPVDDASAISLVSSVPGLSASAVTRDGALFAQRLKGGVGVDLLRIEPDGTTSEWLATPAYESMVQVSADDLYVAYQSDQSGRTEV
jgi:Tol biopolymer transport system component